MLAQLAKPFVLVRIIGVSSICLAILKNGHEHELARLAVGSKDVTPTGAFALPFTVAIPLVHKILDLLLVAGLWAHVSDGAVHGITRSPSSSSVAALTISARVNPAEAGGPHLCGRVLRQR